jgi:hypothetical protein
MPRFGTGSASRSILDQNTEVLHHLGPQFLKRGVIASSRRVRSVAGKLHRMSFNVLLHANEVNATTFLPRICKFQVALC